MQQTMQCDRCGRKLKDKKSVDRGYGPVCFKKTMDEHMQYMSEIMEKEA